RGGGTRRDRRAQASQGRQGARPRGSGRSRPPRRPPRGAALVGQEAADPGDPGRGPHLMRWYSILAIFVLVWTICLFINLPFGIRTHDEVGEAKIPRQAER